MRLIAFFLVLAVVLPLSTTAGTYLRYSIGGTPVVLAYPGSYLELCSVNRDVAEDFKTAIPQESGLLGCYTTSKDLAEFNQRKGGVFDSYLITSVMRGTLRARVNEADFQKFKDQLRTSIDHAYGSLEPEIQRRFKNATKEMSERHGGTIDVRLNSAVPLGVFEESNRHISSAWLAKSTYSIGGSETMSTQVQISTPILAGGMVFVLFTYGEYKSDRDIEKYKDIAKAWTKIFLQENQ